jgi:hypothetical protein
MRKISSLIIALFMSCPFGVYAQEEIPAIETGNWFNPNDPGTGFSLEAQNGIVAGTYFGYENDGDPIWVNFAGLLEEDEADSSMLRLTADLYAYENGQCIINCLDDSSNSNRELDVVGTITLEFSDRDRGQFSVNGGEFQPIEAFIFGVDTLLVSEDVPEFRVPDLSGDWVFSVEPRQAIGIGSAINLTFGEMILSRGNEYDSITFPMTTIDNNPNFFRPIVRSSEFEPPTSLGELRCVVSKVSVDTRYACGIDFCTEGFCASDEEVLNRCGIGFTFCFRVSFNDHRISGFFQNTLGSPPSPLFLIHGFRKNYD